MRKLTVAIAMALVACIASVGVAQEAKKSKRPSDENVAPAKAKAQADKLAPAKLRAKMHRTLAALIEAQSAAKPDQAKIGKLTEQLETLRKQLWAQGPAGRPGQPAGWQCPWGGPGRGYGPGPGYGRGPGRGKGPGYGMGPGRGYGMGPAYGRGGGPGGPWGPGPGRGAGYGRGFGWQRWFVDEDGDGICDNAQPVPEQKK